MEKFYINMRYWVEEQQISINEKKLDSSRTPTLVSFDRRRSIGLLLNNYVHVTAVLQKQTCISESVYGKKHYYLTKLACV